MRVLRVYKKKKNVLPVFDQLNNLAKSNLLYKFGLKKTKSVLQMVKTCVGFVGETCQFDIAHVFRLFR